MTQRIPDCAYEAGPQPLGVFVVSGDFWVTCLGGRQAVVDGGGGFREDRESLSACVRWKMDMWDPGVVEQIWAGARENEDGGQVWDLERVSV